MITKKGSINNIYFYPTTNLVPPENKIKQCIQTALAKSSSSEYNNFIGTYFFSVNHHKLYKGGSNNTQIIHPYSTKTTSIYSDKKYIILKKNELGFDRIDAQEIAGEKALAIADFLSACINETIQLIHEKQTISPPDTYNNILNNDEDWLDGYPYVENAYALSRHQIEIIDKISTSEIGTNSPLLRSCFHFNNALALKAEGYSFGKYDEIVCALLISSIEALCEEFPWETSKCQTCGQIKYSIKQRVKELSTRILGEAAAYHISELYNIRSRTLHCGHQFSNRTSCYITPLIDSSQNNCMKPQGLNILNLTEFTSYLIRKVAIEKY